MGSSIGCLISLYALARYPGVFGGAAALSTHWPVTIDRAMLDLPDALATAQAFRDYLADTLPPTGRHCVYMDRGDQTLDALYTPYQARTNALFSRLGWRADVNVMSRTYPGAAHDELSWRARLDVPLTFLLKAAPL